MSRLVNLSLRRLVLVAQLYVTPESRAMARKVDALEAANRRWTDD